MKNVYYVIWSTVPWTTKRRCQWKSWIRRCSRKHYLFTLHENYYESKYNQSKKVFHARAENNYGVGLSDIIHTDPCLNSELYKLLLRFWLYPIITVIANVQNTCNLIGREECSIRCIVLSVSIFHSLRKKQHLIDVVGNMEDITKTLEP